MKNRFLFTYHFPLMFFILLFSTNELFAQKKSVAADYAENILLAKLKPEFAALFNSNASISTIKNAIAPITLIHYTKTFPTVQAPSIEGHVDLSLVYTLTFSGVQKTDLPALATTLMTTTIFEYVELKYIHNQQAIFYPNDPNVPIYQQNYLGRMGAFQAWAIEQGNPNVVIGIIDTGSDPNHVDLTNNIAYNTLDPVNGVDDDNDGYIDNYTGWDFGNNDNDPTVGYSNNHGAKVSGIAAATPNNGIGGAGIGFNSKILPIKTSTDAGGGAIIAGYDGIIYAANHGCKVINLSWGGTGNYSSLDQDVINYAAINNDVLIVAAAGNTDEEADYYPAAYDNVLSVIAMDTIFSPSANKYIDTRANFTNWACCYKATYSRSVDIGAQGMGLFVTIPTNTYTLQDGSSAASPVVAGAAALVRAHYPNLSALQAAELLRVTADVVDTFPENAAYKEKMGKGRINIYRALTDTKSPSIRFKNITAQTKNGLFLFSGDTVLVTGDFFNYLRPTVGLTLDLSSQSSDIQVILNNISMGVIDSLTSKSNTTNPIKFIIKNTATNNETIELRIGYSDPATGYYDYQYFTIQVNPDYTTLYNDNIKTTITSNGRVGFEDLNSTVGVGFESSGDNVLYEGGLMIGQNSTKVSDCVRSAPYGNSDLDFKPLKNPAFVANSIKYKETFSKFNDSSSTNPLPQGIECLQRSYTFNTTELNNTVFLEYKIINRSNADIDSIYVGHFVDWDIQNYANNRADFDYASRMGYAYDISTNNLYAGLTLLTNQELHYYAMDNSNVGGTNINPNDAYTKAEKFSCLSSNTGRSAAGINSTGNDISMSMAGRINHLKKGDTVVVAFALLTSHTTLLDLQLQSTAAIQKFIEIHTGTTPLANSAKLCTNDTSNFTISPSPGNSFNFYTEIPVSTSTPAFKGKSYTLTNVSSADTIYVTNTDSLYESTYSRFVVLENKAPIAAFSFTADIADAASLFTNESIRYQSVLWNFGDNQTSIEDNPTHVYTIPGNYVVTLKSSDNETCIDSIEHTINIVSDPLAITTSTNTTVKLYPIPANEIVTLEFQQNDNTSIDIIVFNAMGQQVMQKNQVPLLNNQVRLSVASLETGLYFIQIKNMASQLRFVKQ
jgi:serine protease